MSEEKRKDKGGRHRSCWAEKMDLFLSANTVNLLIQICIAIQEGEVLGFFVSFNSLFHLSHPAEIFPFRKWKESEPLLGSHVMPAHCEQRKLIGLSPNHREKSSLKVSLGNKVWDFFFCCKKKKKKKRGRSNASKRADQTLLKVSGLC